MTPERLALLRLTLTPGLGPVFISRLAESLGSYAAILDANEHALRRVRGIGEDRARVIARGLVESERLADSEIKLAAQLGVGFVGIHEPHYPPLLREIPNAPPLLYFRGELDPAGHDKYSFAIVGSRSCTMYGTEQAERFAMALAQAGLTIVSGGARGIDTAAHRGAVRVKGRTIAVLGCGLAHCYPPDNQDLFDTIAGAGHATDPGSAGSVPPDSLGAIISELPLNTPPTADNFPARNRIISGLSLGVLLIEAGRKSGALITAQQAVEEHGREVFALPARVDSAASLGSLDLIKSGGAAMVTHPDDILSALESPARHLHTGTHEARYAVGVRGEAGGDGQNQPLFAHAEVKPSPSSAAPSIRDAALSERQAAILAALDEPRTMDELSKLIAIEPSALRSEVTILEIRRRLVRKGSQLVRTA